MKFNKKLLPYYISRAILSGLLGWWTAASMGSTLVGMVTGALVYIGFLYYLHSGRFVVDESHPLFPLRRDEGVQEIRNQSLVVAIVVLGLSYVILQWLRAVGMGIIGLTWAPAVAAVVVYFGFGWMLGQKAAK